MEKYMNELDVGNQIVSTALSTLSFFDTLYSKVENIKNKKLSIQNYLRAYYFEVLHNIELLNTVDIKKFKTLPVNSSVFHKFIMRLDIQIGATILFTEEIDKTSDLYKLLKTKGRIQNKNRLLVTNQKGIEITYAGKILYENILQAISFTVVKIELLQHLSEFDTEEMSYLHPILLERRITNIKERLIMIKTVMDQIDGIQELSR
jgi:hypothetical protein